MPLAWPGLSLFEHPFFGSCHLGLSVRTNGFPCTSAHLQPQRTPRRGYCLSSKRAHAGPSLERIVGDLQMQPMTPSTFGA